MAKSDKQLSMGQARRLTLITKEKLALKKGRAATQGINLRKTSERRTIEEICYKSLQLLIALDEILHRRMCEITGEELLKSVNTFANYM